MCVNEVWFIIVLNLVKETVDIQQIIKFNYNMFTLFWHIRKSWTFLRY